MLKLFQDLCWSVASISCIFQVATGQMLFHGVLWFQLRKIQRDPAIKCMRMMWSVCFLKVYMLSESYPVQSGHIAWCWGEVWFYNLRFISRKNCSHFHGLPVRLEPLHLKEWMGVTRWNFGSSMVTRPVMLAIVVTDLTQGYCIKMLVLKQIPYRGIWIPFRPCDCQSYQTPQQMVQLPKGELCEVQHTVFVM